MMPLESPGTSEFEEQLTNASMPELSADDLDWIFNADATTNGVFDGPGDWQSLDETDRWLNMAAQNTFALTDMDPYPYLPHVP